MEHTRLRACRRRPTRWLPDRAVGRRDRAQRRVPRPTITHRRLTADLALLDDVGAERRSGLPRDAGGNAPLLHADAASALSVPALPRAQVPPTQAFRSRLRENSSTSLLPGAPASPTPNSMATRVQNDAPNDRWSSLRAIRARQCVPAPGPDGFIDRLRSRSISWVRRNSEHYIGEFHRTGFTGGLNWRPAISTATGDHGRLRQKTTTLVPSLFIAGAAGS